MGNLMQNKVLHKLPVDCLRFVVENKFIIAEKVKIENKMVKPHIKYQKVCFKS